MNFIVIGIGQSMRGDDAAGLEAVKLWQSRFSESAARVQVEFCELPGLGLLDLLEGVDAAVLVDAVQSSKSPGTVLRLGSDDLASFTPETGSAHGWGVAETLTLGRRLYSSLVNCRITLIGIVGEDFNLGAKLSLTVSAALEMTANMIEAEIQNVTEI